MKLPTTIHANRNRQGFTLLELLLALALGVLLLGGLYFSMYTTLQQTQSSRDAVDAESTSRAVFNKMTLDLSSVLGPAPPKSGGAPATGATSVVTTTGTDTTTGTSATPTDVSTPTDTSTDPTATDGSQDAAAQNIAFQVGVIGNGTQLTIFASRVPNILSTPGMLNQTSDAQQPSDLVRIDYWKGANGLCRLERPWITADQTGNSFALDTSSESTSLIAEEVTDVMFQYFDGTSWLETWDTTSSGASPTPPVAVSVTLTFSRPNPQGDPFIRKVSQTMAVRTAPGATVPELVDPVMSSTTTATTDTGGGM